MTAATIILAVKIYIVVGELLALLALRRELFGSVIPILDGSPRGERPVLILATWAGVMCGALLWPAFIHLSVRRAVKRAREIEREREKNRRRRK
jgi:hypothetical protein